MMLQTVLKKITTPRVDYDPLIHIYISKAAILHNHRAYSSKFSRVRIAPVLKSNAYGHGFQEVASILDPEDVPFFAVDSFYEALTLRQARVKSPILIMGYVRSELLNRKTLRDVSYSILSLPQLEQISKELKIPQTFHLKIDTGMHRHGLWQNEFEEGTKLIKANPNIRLAGIFSHFANAYDRDSTFSQKQIKSWNSAVDYFKVPFPELRYFHLSATAGFSHSADIRANVARIGIGSYGINTSPQCEIDLEPALEMRSVIASIKSIPACEKVGYNLLFESGKPMTLATVPLGYNEGVDLRLTNCGMFEVKGKLCPIVGRVSMNITTIDVSEVEDLRLEDEVVIISREKNKPNSVVNIASVCGTSPYEILVHLPAYLRREVI